MKKHISFIFMLCLIGHIQAQTNPAITSWLINTTGITGRHYVSGNPTPISDTALVNVKTVQYSTNNVYIRASGLPSYIIGPYQDGNPAQGTSNNYLYKIPLSPVQNTGTLSNTPLGAIGLFINGVAVYDCKDAYSYKASSGTNVQQGDGIWNRDAIVAERAGFDCAKGHPSPIFVGGPPPQGTLAGGNYHHHQNPSAFNLDKVVISNVCDLYVADGLYLLDSTVHSPLIGFAFDGFPIYGGFGFANTDGTGGIKRIQSSYTLRNISTRTHYADGTDVADGPAVSTTFPLGIYREDYEFVSGSGDLDVFNGRFCNTPEYPAGTYAYFATIDANWNSAYPYIIGPQYYGVVSGAKVNTVTEPVTDYSPTTAITEFRNNSLQLNIFPNPASDLIAVQLSEMAVKTLYITMFDLNGKEILSTQLYQGSTLAHLDTRRLYAGEYIIQIRSGNYSISKTVLLEK